MLLHKLYSSETNWATSLPKTFIYSQLRDRLFASSHLKSEQTKQCSDRTCICYQTFSHIVFASEFQQFEPEWQQQILQLTGMSAEELQPLLHKYPFATVHRSIRDDLKHLTQQGWLQMPVKGQYQCLPAKDLPKPPSQTHTEPSLSHLSLPQAWQLLRILESVAFVQPNLDVIVRSLWEQIADVSPSPQLNQEPQQRIFLHLDYILGDEMQDRVDTYQKQIEQLWHKPPGGVVQFEYWVAAAERKVKVTVYPVCLHYLRRAKYLSAYGIDLESKFGWHNYRLDRIASDRLTVLAWGDSRVPKQLKEMWHTGTLPTSQDIQAELDAAWGFNFYLPRELLILRFPSSFAKWYVDKTFRHPTFRAIAYNQLPKLITQEISNPQECQQLLNILNKRSSEDTYYTAWIRTGDINVLMRLRDWRPKGEVIAPLSIRQQLAEEAAQELANYHETWK
ncbi:MAG: TIGR03985 family CRISPR-associated protein [Rhizonema sp. PD38]|nr:TIGR03985 family CRISPR-associated protein [Rhizonema sp. PD38]